MSNSADEYADEGEEVEMEEETRRQKKKRRSTTASGVGETSSSKTPMKPGRKEEIVWKYVTELEGLKNRVKCKLCKKEFSGGAPRIKVHLGRKEGKDIARCKKLYKLKKKRRKRKSLPPIEQEGTENVDATRSSPEREGQSDADCTISSPPISLHLHDSNSSPDPALVPTSSCPQEITHDDEEYKELVKHLVVSNAEIPTSQSMRFKKALESLKREVGQYIDEVKKSWCNTGLTWKIHFRERTYNESPEKSDVLGYTVYCPKGLIFLDNEKMPGEIKKAMEKEVTQILCDLDYENERQALFSCGGNMVVPEFSKRISICAPVEILRLLDRVVEECEWLSNILMDAKKIYQVLKRTKKALVASKVEHPLSELQAIIQHKKELESGSAFCNRSETLWISFLEDGEEALDAVWPLIQILGIFDCFIPNIGYFYEAFEMAGKRIKDRHAANPQKFKELWEQFELLKPCVIQPIHVASAYLNPSYALNERSNEDKINENKVRKYMRKFLIESNEEETLENELAKYKQEDSPLFTQEAISAVETHHPVRWWEKFGEPTPLLSRCAIRLLSQPSNCLSHFCHKPKFEALKSERLDLLRLNVRMMEEFKELEETNMIFKPIDLSKIDAPAELEISMFNRSFQLSQD